MLTAGSIMGPLLDGIHGRAHLLEYDVARLDTEWGLHSSWTVPVLLGVFYVILGAAHVAADAWQVDRDDEATAALTQRVNLPYAALTTGCVAALLLLSAVLFSAASPVPVIHATLAVAAVAAWKLLDGTKQGLLLACMCAVAAPLSEVVLNEVFGLWHYTRPDLVLVQGWPGITSWVCWCYFFYTVSVGNLARAAWRAFN